MDKLWYAAVALTATLIDPGVLTWAEVRKRRGLTQASLGARDGLSSAPIYSLEVYGRYEHTALEAVSIRPAGAQAPQVIHVRPRSPHGDWYEGPAGSVVRILILVFLLTLPLLCLL